jgi:hypothetical protein
VSIDDLEPAQQPYLGLGLLLAGREEEAAALLTRLVRAARERGLLATLPYALVRLGDAELELGHWGEAARHLYEAETLAAESGQTADQGLALGALAWLRAAQGDEDECRACAEDALRIADLLGVGSRYQATSALGLLELGRGRPETALEHLTQFYESRTAGGWSDASFAPHVTIDLVAAYAGARQSVRALAAAETFAAEADRVGRPSAGVAATLCRGIATTGDEAERHLGEALAAPADQLRPFVRARAQLALAEGLLTAGRGDEAAAQLPAAGGTFAALGAVPWAERTRARLVETGSTVQDVGVAAPLRTAEAAVVECVRSGLTITETARRLLLTERTVERQLRRAEQHATPVRVSG